MYCQIILNGLHTFKSYIFSHVCTLVKFIKNLKNKDGFQIQIKIIQLYVRVRTYVFILL